MIGLNNNMKRTTVQMDDRLASEIDRLIPGVYINRTELVLKAIRKLLKEEHNISFDPVV